MIPILDMMIAVGASVSRLAPLLLFAVYLLPPRLTDVSAVEAEPQVPMQKGMSYATWWSGEYVGPGPDKSLELLASTGANWIALVVTAYQETHTATVIDYGSERVSTDQELIHVISEAHDLGLKVMLKPHVDLEREWVDGYWRGDIGTEFYTEAEWSSWFASYRDFINHYASLAEAYGADQFCLGTELSGTTAREADWRQTIAEVRALYQGPIVYAAQHSEEAASIPFWDALDYIGVNAYYPLADDPSHHATLEELESAWVEPMAIMAELSATEGKPIIITEIGYRSHHFCSGHPWDSWAVSEVDLEEQAFAYQAAFSQLYDQPWLAGIYWWTWYPDRFRSGPCDDSFSPHLKPAEDVLRAWYGAAPLPEEPEYVADYDRAMDIYVDGLARGWEDWSWEATVDMGASAEIHSGSQAISVTLQPWGGFSLWHRSFDDDAYHWLEFYVRSTLSSEPLLVAAVDTPDGTRLTPVPVNHCNHIEGGAIASDSWKRVRIPLADLNVTNVEWVRLSLQNASGEASVSFVLDDIRLVPASPGYQVFLPSSIKH